MVMPYSVWTSASHWLVAIWSQVEPAPSTVTDACAGTGVPAADANTAIAARNVRQRRREKLAEAPIHVVRCPLVVRVREDHLGGADLDDLPGLALVHVEEGALMRHALGLLHV